MTPAKAKSKRFVKPENARFTVCFNPELGWAVFDSGGYRITDWGLTETKAGKIAKLKQYVADQRLGKATRPCMCCRKLFPSDGKHNRLCAYCKAAA